jgi:hypothetical protein
MVRIPNELGSQTSIALAEGVCSFIATAFAPDQTSCCQLLRSGAARLSGNQLTRSVIMLMQVTNQTFTHSLTIYLKDSNAYGNTYFARYFEWQGICREKWFFECISRDMLQKEGVFITKHAEQDYLQETFPFQELRAS